MKHKDLHEEQELRNLPKIVCMLTIVFLSLLLFIYNLGFDVNSDIAPPNPLGDTFIDGITKWENQTIVLDGNLTINSTGRLTLYNVTLLINSTYDGQYKINVTEGGKLLVYYSNISAYDTTTIPPGIGEDPGLRYNITVYGNMTIDSSNISYLWGHPTFGGFPGSIQIYSNDVRISNSEIFWGEMHGIYADSASNLTIVNCNLTRHHHAIHVLKSNVTIIDNNVRDSGYALWTFNSSVYVADNDFEGEMVLDEGTKAYVTYNKIANSNNGIVVNGGGTNVTISNNLISNMNGDNIYVSDPSNTIISNNIIENGSRGIYFHGCEKILIMDNLVSNHSSDGVAGWGLVGYEVEPILINNILRNSGFSGASAQSYSSWLMVNNSISNSAFYDVFLGQSGLPSNMTLLNTTFNKTNVYYQDTVSNLTTQWYMHVKVVDLNDKPVIGANVEVKDVYGAVSGAGVTGSDGHLRWIVAKEYYQNDTNGDTDGEDPGEKIFYTPHNVTAWKDGAMGWADSEPFMNESKVVIVRIPMAYTTYTITKEPLQGNVTVDSIEYTAPAIFNWLPGESHNVSVDSPEYQGSNIKYIFDYWDDGGTQMHDVFVGSVDKVITAYYKTQYKPNITLMGTDAAHTVTAYHTKNGIAESDLGTFASWSDWCDNGTSLYFDIDATGSTATERWHTDEDFAVNPWISVSSPFSATVVYYHQYNVTITTTGLVSSYPATVTAIQGGNPINPTTYIMWNDWVDADSILSIDETVTVSATERYHTIDTFSWTVSSPISATVNYYHQYLVTIATTGLIPAYPATISVSQYGIVNNPTTSTSWSDWADAASTLGIEDTVTVSVRERYHTTDVVSWTVNSAVFSTVYYIHQYMPVVTLVGTDSAHAVSVQHMLDGSAHSDINIFNSWSDWSDEGSTLAFDECTTGAPTRCTTDIRSFIVDSAFDATITYTVQPITTIHVGTPQYLSTNIYVNSSTQFWFSVLDYSGTGYKTYYYVDTPPWNLYNGAFTILVEGEHTIYFNSTDNLGGIEDTKIFEVIVDNTPPVTTYILQLEDGETEARISLIATDVGSGVNFTKYRVDSGDWTTYSSAFMLNESGWHTIYFWSADRLGNVENEKNLSILIREPGTTIPPSDRVKETNYKPFIALIFSIILLLVGLYVSYKRPLNLKEEIKKNRLLTWIIVVLPFVIAEIMTGIISFLTGLLSVPPLLGAGMVVDLVILIIGLIAFTLIFRKSGREV